MSFQVPKVHFTFRDIAKSTNHENLAKWTDLNRVFELLSEFKLRLSIEIVKRGTCRLLARNHDELLSVRRPLHILNLVVENRNEFPILSLVDTDVLQRVLSIVTLPRRVVLVLGPNENGVSRGRRNNYDVVCSWTRDIELGSLKITVQIVHIDESIVLGFGQNFSILPSHQVASCVVGAHVFGRNWAKNEPIKLAIVHSGVFLGDTVNLRQRRQLGFNLQFRLAEVAFLVDFNDILCDLSC